MELILLENVINLGKIGESSNCKKWLWKKLSLKQGKALRFSKENLDEVNKKKDELIKKNESRKRI